MTLTFCAFSSLTISSRRRVSVECQTRRRLVHDNDASTRTDRARDLHELLLGE